MDPLSVSASAIALLGAGGKVAKLLKEGISLKCAPEVVQAHNDEVLELRLIANDVDGLLHTAIQDYRSLSLTSLKFSLDGVKSTILQLESFISYELTTIAADGVNVRVDKSVFIRAESRLQQFKDEVCARKMTLSTALTVFVAAVVMRTQSESR